MLYFVENNLINLINISICAFFFCIVLLNKVRFTKQLLMIYGAIIGSFLASTFNIFFTLPTISDNISLLLKFLAYISILSSTYIISLYTVFTIPVCKIKEKFYITFFGIPTIVTSVLLIFFSLYQKFSNISLHILCSNYIFTALAIIFIFNIFKRKDVTLHSVRTIVPIFIAAIIFSIYSILLENLYFLIFGLSVVSIFYYVLFHVRSVSNIGTFTYDAFKDEIHDSYLYKKPITTASFQIQDYTAVRDEYGRDILNIDKLKLISLIENKKICNKIFLEKSELITFTFKGTIEENNEKILELFKLLKENSSNLIYKFVVLDTIKAPSMKDYDFTRNECLNKCNINSLYFVKESDIQDIEKFDNFSALLNSEKWAINNEDTKLVTYFQPIVAKDGSAHYEALSRLILNGKMVYPSEFISFIERFHYEHRFSLMVLDNVCKFISKCSNENIDIKCISVNFFFNELTIDTFLDDITNIVNNYNINHSKICIELIETPADVNNSFFVQKVKEIQDSGFLVYLDDFGSGFSDFNRLVEIPFNVVKFDKDLVWKTNEDLACKDIVKLLVSMFKKYNMEIVFEGIENENFINIANELDADYQQGFFYSKPISADDLFLSLKQNNF